MKVIRQLTCFTPLLCVLSASAADQTWQTDNTNNTWNTSNFNWDAGVAWSNGNTAIFVGGGEAITVDTVTANALSFSGNGYSLGGGTLTLGGPVVTVNSGISATIGSTVTGSAGLTKEGTGTLILTGTKSYTGNTILNGGILRLDNSVIGTTASDTVSGTGTLEIGSHSGLLAWNATNATVGSSFTGLIDVKTTYATSPAARGFFINGNSNFANNLGDMNIGSGFGMFINGSTVQVDELNGEGSITCNNASGNNAILRLGANNGSGAFSGNIQRLSTRVMSLVKTGTGTQVLSGTNNYGGTTTVSGGTLQFAKTASLYNSTTASWTAANLNVASGATLALNVGGSGEFSAVNVNTLLTNISTAASATTGLQAGARLGFDTTNAGVGGFTQGNAIANSTGANGGAIGLTKLGTGTLVLDKINTYTGATQVSGGTLLVNGSTHSNSSVSVTAGATLGGTGSIGGTVNVTGVLAPGASIESLFTGSLAMNSGSKLALEIQDTSTTGADLLAINGDLALNGTITLDLTKLGTAAWLQDDKLTLVSYTGSWNGGFFTYDGNELIDGEEFTFDNMLWTLDYNDSSEGNNFSGDSSGSYVTMTVVPEPKATLMGALGLLCLLRRRR